MSGRRGLRLLDLVSPLPLDLTYELGHSGYEIRAIRETPDASDDASDR